MILECVTENHIYCRRLLKMAALYAPMYEEDRFCSVYETMRASRRAIELLRWDVRLERLQAGL